VCFPLPAGVLLFCAKVLLDPATHEGARWHDRLGVGLPTCTRSSARGDAIRAMLCATLVRARDTTGNTNLWVTNGTAAGTHELSVSGAYTGAGGPTLGDLTAIGLHDPATGHSQLVQAMASFSPTGSGGALPLPTQADVRLTDYLAPSH
jgi:hypothetical protein